MKYLQYHAFQIRLWTVLKVARLRAKLCQHRALLWLPRFTHWKVKDICGDLWLSFLLALLHALSGLLVLKCLCILVALVYRGNEFGFSESIIVKLWAWFPQKAGLWPSPAHVFGSSTFLLPCPVPPYLLKSLASIKQLWWGRRHHAGNWCFMPTGSWAKGGLKIEN